MKVFCNDQSHVFDAQEISLHEFLQHLGYQQPKGVALAINENIVPKSLWAKYKLREGDNVLIIKATQGG